MLKVSVIYHLKSTSLHNEDGLTTYSLILTAITYGLSLRNSGRSLVKFNITDSSSWFSKMLRPIGLITTPKLRTY